MRPPYFQAISSSAARTCAVSQLVLTRYKLLEIERPTLRGGSKVVATQDIAYGQLVDVVPQIRESTLDPSIAPGRIFGSVSV